MHITITVKKENHPKRADATLNAIIMAGQMYREAFEPVTVAETDAAYLVTVKRKEAVAHEG